MKLFLSTLATTGALLVALASSVHADSVFFFNQGDQDVAGPYSLGGLTITGSDTLAFRSGRGLSILSGNDDGIIGGNEFATFTFDAGSATGVTFQSFAASSAPGGNDLIGIEGFGVGGGSLGIQQENYIDPLFAENISGFFGNVPLSAFRVIGGLPNTGVDVYRITFTPNAVTTPEPGSIALFVGMSLTGSIFLKGRRK